MNVSLDTNQDISGYDFFSLVHNETDGSLCEQRHSFICLGHIHIGKHFAVKGLEIGLTVTGSSSYIDVIPGATTVVYHIDLMWSKSGTSADDEARSVVSERGLILSPKNAPEMTAPAARPTGIPSPAAMPQRTTPIVLIEP